MSPVITSFYWSRHQESNPDQLLTRQPLYRLSYNSAVRCEGRIFLGVRGGSDPPFLASQTSVLATRRPNPLELMMGLEPITSFLPRRCSTFELHQRVVLPPGLEPGTFCLSDRRAKPVAPGQDGAAKSAACWRCETESNRP